MESYSVCPFVISFFHIMSSEFICVVAYVRISFLFKTEILQCMGRPHFKKILFMAMLGLGCCTGIFLVVASKGCSRVVVHGLLTAVTSLVAKHEL